MKKTKVIFCDIDGTILFHENPNLNLDNKNILDVSTNLYNCYIDTKTIELFHKLSKKYLIILVSGARLSSLQKRAPILNFFDYAIIENGAIIFDKNLKKDNNWENELSFQKKYLIDIQNELESNNWNLDIKGRKASLRIRKKDNLNKSKNAFDNLYNTIKLPKELKKTKNLGAIDIILEKAGKANAIIYLLNKLNLNQENTIGIGDDINDIEMLETTNKSFVLGSGYQEILEIAKQKKWFISKNKYFDGINEILEKILKH